MSELKRCPFCWCEAELKENTTHDFFVRCTNKQCASRTRNYHENHVGAISSWNTRYEETCYNMNYEFSRSWKCSLCGEDFEVPMDDEHPFKYCPGCGARVVEVD